MSVSQPPRSPTFSMLSPPRSPSWSGQGSRTPRGGGVSGRRRRHGPPPTNSSTTTPAPPSKSWDDGDDPVPMRVWTPRWSTSDTSRRRSTPDDDRSVASDPVSFLRARPMYPHKQQPSDAAPHWIHPSPISPNTNDTTTVDTTDDDDDDVSTLGEEVPLRVQRWTTAVTLQVPPANMTRDERMLWEAIQNTASGTKKDTTTQEEDKEELLTTLTNERDEARADQLLAQERWQQERLELQQQLGQLKLQQQQGNNQKTDDSGNNNDNLEKQLQEKTTALESAKMIITSLEHASGCLKTELRQKLKDQQQKMEQIQATNQAQQTSIAHMTLELKQARKAQANDRQRKEQLQTILRHNLHHMREAGVVLEATQDATAVDTLSRLLQETMQALESVAHDENNNNNNSTDQCNQPKRRCVTARSMSSSSSSDEEEDHNEQQLQRLQDEHRRLLKEQERKHQTELSALDQQKQELQNQCRSHLAVLARKEQELAVLRRDRNVDQDNQTGGMGYISDEESDDEDNDNHHSDGTTSSPDQQYYSASSSNSNNNTHPSDTYDPSQAAALANLLLANGNPADSGVILQCQLIQTQSQAEQARQELQAERQSLANAKMIISSLEKANSQMMEDLRSRLHDSNTAIASLLEKSLKAETNTAKLRTQLENLQREKQQEHERMQSEMDRLRRQQQQQQQQQGTTTTGNTWSATTVLQQQQYREEKKDEVIETID